MLEEILEINKMHDTLIEAAEMMEKYGGSFYKSLAQCIYHADLTNEMKIWFVWRQKIEEYAAEWRKDHPEDVEEE